jgi:hypothetical protein
MKVLENQEVLRLNGISQLTESKHRNHKEKQILSSASVLRATVTVEVMVMPACIPMKDPN